MTEEQKIGPETSPFPAKSEESLSVPYSRSSHDDEKELYKLKIILRDEFKFEVSTERSLVLTEVLSRLRKLIKDWVYQTALKRKLSPETASKAGGELYVSGSLRLGVHEVCSDLDALCVVPRFVDRDEDFFGDFLTILAAHPDIENLRGIKYAYVPLIKMKFYNVDIDLLFARLRFESVEDSLKDLKDDSVLKECDDQTVYSINTYRNNDLILSLVPHQDHFMETLKFIKVWAKRRDLYSNKVGYLGGISWAILTAKICQHFPQLTPNRLLEKFFSYFCKWNWRLPVLLCDIKEPSDIQLSIKQWNPKMSEGDLQQVMPIITPAFPCVNSAFNVSKITKKILLEEFQRSARIIKKINARKPKFTWMTLFKRYDFFRKYTHYLRIDALSNNPEDHLKWEGFVASKIRLLIQELETYSQDICNIRPYTKPFVIVDAEYKYCTTFLCGFNFRDPQKLPNYNQEYIVDLRAPILKFCEKIMGLYQRPGKFINMRITHTTIEKLQGDGIRPIYFGSKKSRKQDMCIDHHNKDKIAMSVESIPLVEEFREEPAQ